MRKACLESVYQLARQDERIFFIGSDLGPGTLAHFKEEMPERFFMEGISEANILGMAAGLALEGKVVYVNTIAPFMSRRAYEQIVLDLCLHRVPVRLIGNGGGFVYGPLGPTHQLVEDLAALRAVPNLTILAPADANEMRRLMPHTVDHPGPIYIRLAKGGDPLLTPADGGFTIGAPVVMREGSDALVISTGAVLHLGLAAAETLAGEGLSVGVIHLPTLKPLDGAALLERLAPVPVVVTVEEHSIIGGLGGAVAELIAEAGFERPKRFRRIGAPDRFPEICGSQEDVLENFGITTARLVETLLELTAGRR